MHAAVTPEVEERVLQLAREGVPDAWIAEEVGLSIRCVWGHRSRAGIPADAEWKPERLRIQHDARLFALHLEFAPASLRMS